MAKFFTHSPLLRAIPNGIPIRKPATCATYPTFPANAYATAKTLKMKYKTATRPKGMKRKRIDDFNGLMNITAAASVKIAPEAPTIETSNP